MARAVHGGSDPPLLKVFLMLSYFQKKIIMFLRGA